MKTLIIICTIIGFALMYIMFCLCGSLFTDIPILSVLNAAAGLVVVVGVSCVVVISTAIIRNENNSKK
jgi:hypothetical protein